MTAPIKSSKNFSIRLNSEGLCFICLRDTKANGGDHSPPPTSFRLRNITRFLGIDTKEILKAYLDYDLKRCSDVKVELCEGCSEQVQKFNCLYQSLELTKLKLNECVQKISSLIKEAKEECDDDRTGEMERRVTHAGTIRAIIDLRTGISEKCLQFSGTVPPWLTLKQLPESELAKCSSRKPLATESTSTPIKIEVSEDDDESRSFTDTAASQISDSDTESESVISQEKRRIQIKARSSIGRLDGKFSNHEGMTPAISKYISEIDHQLINSPRFPDGTLRASCPHCRASFASRVPSHLKRFLENHLASFHLRTFFQEEDLKAPSLSSCQFQQVIHHHLFANIATDPENVNFIKCPDCSVTMPLRLRPRLRMHVIRCHYKSLIQRLHKLQKDSMLLSKLSKIPKELICKCGAYCSIPKIYNQHRSKFCNLTDDKTPANNELSEQSSEIVYQRINNSSSSKLPPKKSVQTPCPHCRAVIKTKFVRNLRSVLEEHLIRHHLQTYFPQDKYKEPSLSPYQFKQVIHHFLFESIASGNPDPKKEDSCLKCPHCNVTVLKKNLVRFKIHLIKFHYSDLSHRLEELQKDELIFEKLAKIRKAFVCECGDYFRSRKHFEDHREKFCNRENDEGETSCQSTFCVERDPLAFESSEDENVFCSDDDGSGSVETSNTEVGDVKPSISIPSGTESLEEDVGARFARERKRRGSEVDSDDYSSSPESKCAPPKLVKTE